MWRHLSPTVLVLVGVASVWPLHVAADDSTQQPQFGFRMGLQTVLDLLALAPELPDAHWAGITADGQRAWETGQVTTVYNTGSYLEGDFNADGHADAALLLEETQPDGAPRRHLLLATRTLPGGPWRRVALIAVAADLADATVDHVLERMADTGGPDVAVFLSDLGWLKTSEAEPPPVAGALAVSPRSVETWIAQLDDSDPRARLSAAEALGAETGPGSVKAIDALVRRFYDPEEVVRDAAVESLRRIGPGVVPAVRALVEREGATLGRHDPGARAQRLAVNLIGTLSPATDEAAALASDVCRARTMHDVVRHDACLSLAQLARREPRRIDNAVRILLDVFQEPDADPYLRTELMHQLTGFGPVVETVAAFARALQDREVFIRRAAAGSLATFGEAARPVLAELQAAAHDPDAEVRASAERAVKQLSPPDVQPSIEPAIESAR